MFKFTKTTDYEGLKKAIDEALLQLALTKPGSSEYDEVLKNIERLFKLQAPQPEARKLLSPDAVVSAAASLAGIVLIIHHEQVGIVTSKALGFVLKAKA